MEGIASRSVGPYRPAASSPARQATSAESFSSVLERAQTPDEGLKLSAHAQSRLQQRGVTLTAADLTRLQNAVTAAAGKGSKDAYLLYGDAGFVVNVPNRTVITAMVNREETIVTNIDSVVIVPRPDR